MKMADLRRLDEALEWANRDTPGLLGTHPHILTLAEFATTYRGLLADGLEPDYEAATKKTGHLLGIAFPGRWDRGGLPRLVEEIVDAAVGGRVLVGPPKEKE